MDSISTVNGTATATAPAAISIAAPPAPTPANHARLDSFLKILERIGLVALTLAPAVAAPFVKNANSAAIFSAEAPIAQALAQELQAALDTPPAA